MLDLHEESGLAAIQACGLYDEFLPLAGECAQATHVSDETGKLTWADEGDLEYRPEVSRNALSSLLSRHLPDSAIRWGWKLVGASTDDNTGITTLDFGQHGSITADLVVGADGAWSRVRSLLLPTAQAKPDYANTQALTITMTGINTKRPDLVPYAGLGTMFILGSGHGIFGHRGALDSERLYVMLYTEQEDFPAASGFSKMRSTEVSDALFRGGGLLSSWSGDAAELIKACCQDEDERRNGGLADIKPLYHLPIGHSWENRPGVTAIGDASHLILPFAGEGVNLAMWDSLDLSTVIGDAWDNDSIKFKANLKEPLAAFEKMMAERAKHMAEETANNTRILFGENAAQAMADLFKSFGPPPE
jgi:2-polyprenyl-6-methoxyphenol hydroxylase-like FAD-dependent oxidoreductase